MGLCFLKLWAAFQIRIDHIDPAEDAGFFIGNSGRIKETGVFRWVEMPSFPGSRDDASHSLPFRLSNCKQTSLSIPQMSILFKTCEKLENRHLLSSIMH